MNSSTARRAIAATAPLALLAGAAIAASAKPVVVNGGAVRPSVVAHPQTISPNVVVSAYAGGATFPIPAYVGQDLSSGSFAPGNTGSVFGYLFPAAQYCATGSGKGKAIFEGPLTNPSPQPTPPITQVQNPCANAGTGTPPYGFSAPAGTKIPALTGSDAALTQTDYSAYLNTTTGPASLTKEPSEFPSVFGSVAIFLNEPGCVNGAVQLKAIDIVNIYNGSTKTWSQIKGCSASDTTPIVPVYRSDSSGTSSIFSNYLAVNVGGVNATPQFVPGATNAVGQKGNGGIYNYVQATKGTVGYVEEGFIVVHPPTAGFAALVYNPTQQKFLDPKKNLPEAAASISSASILKDSAVVFGTGKATTAPLTGVPTAGCVFLVNPSAYATPSKGYPIIGVTYLLAAYQGNGGLATSEQKVINGLNTLANFGTNIKTVNKAVSSSSGGGTGTTGYSSLNFGTFFSSSVVASCIKS